MYRVSFCAAVTNVYSGCSASPRVHSPFRQAAITDAVRIPPPSHAAPNRFHAGRASAIDQPGCPTFADALCPLSWDLESTRPPPPSPPDPSPNGRAQKHPPAPPRKNKKCKERNPRVVARLGMVLVRHEKDVPRHRQQ